MKSSSLVSVIVFSVIVGLVVLEGCLQSNRVDVLVRNSSGAVVHEVRVSEYGQPLLEIAELKVGMVRRCSYRAETDGGVDLYYRGVDGESMRGGGLLHNGWL